LTQPALAIPKSKLCKPGICLKVKEIRNRRVRRSASRLAKSLAPLEQFLITAPKVAQYSGDYSTFPPESGSTTLGIKVPAGRDVVPNCTIVAGKPHCYDVVTVGECPSTLKVKDEGTSVSYECDTDCTGPDSNGDSDCQILYNTCR